MKVKKKVVAAGHACLDITPVFPRSGGCRRIGDVLVPGRLIQMEGVSISSGGSVSNTGLAMRLLGAEVCLMAKTGMDEFGKILPIFTGNMVRQMESLRCRGSGPRIPQ